MNKIGRPRIFPHLPDIDGLIAEVRDRMTRMETQIAAIARATGAASPGALRPIIKHDRAGEHDDTCVPCAHCGGCTIAHEEGCR